jgi:hypothetical protein
MLRYIKPGDIFMFAIDAGRFGIGRVISTVSLGHVVEFFEPVLERPTVDGLDFKGLKRRGSPVVLDSYSLFDKKLEGDWRIVAHQEGFEPQDVEHVYFTYGAGSMRKKVDAFGKTTDISASDAANLPLYSPSGDKHVKQNLYAAV